uniref:Uncharacterized protein n=1 Tax=Triticum urartu TaxID=4572 RepID=A0A8R7UL28_TRIUA
MTLTVVNPIWPGIQGNAGSEVLEGGGFSLPSRSHRSFPPTHAWSSRIWARTGCATGDCDGRLQFSTAGLPPPRRQRAIVLRGERGGQLQRGPLRDPAQGPRQLPRLGLLQGPDPELPGRAACAYMVFILGLSHTQSSRLNSISSPIGNKSA